MANLCFKMNFFESILNGQKGMEYVDLKLIYSKYFLKIVNCNLHKRNNIIELNKLIEVYGNSDGG